MKKMTEKSLNEAFAGESMARMKYQAYADVAKSEGKENIARLFEATSYAERVHAINHARELGYIGSTTENLQGGIDGEGFEIDEMYPAYDAIAKLQGEKGAEKSIHFAIEAEKIHKVLYTDALAKAKDGGDIDDTTVYVCPKCGYTHKGSDVPDKCPICGVPKDKFVKF